MFAVLEVVSAIVGLNVLGFGILYIATKIDDAKQAKRIADYNAKALHSYRVAYGAEGIEA